MKRFILFLFLFTSVGQAKLQALPTIEEIIHQLNTGKYELALENISKVDLNEINDEKLLLLSKKTVLKETPDGLNPNLFLKLSTEGFRILTIIEKRLIKSKAKQDKLHPVQLLQARALCNLSKLRQAKNILEDILEEKKFGDDSFEERFLLGHIAAQQNDWNAVSKIFSRIMAIASRLQPDLKRDLRIKTEWAGAYENVQNNIPLIQKGRGLALMAKSVQINILDDESLKYVEKANYLVIHYSKKAGVNIKELKKKFLKEFPTSKYSLRVRRL